MAAWVSKSKAYAKACTSSAGSALFNHVKTTDNVADMESLRKALGQQQINYYGFSYGTYLGSVYMTLHPDRVRRFVLDSTVDPRHVFYQSNLDQDVAFQKTIEIFFDWVAKYDSVYHLGNTGQAVEKLFRLERTDQGVREVCLVVAVRRVRQGGELVRPRVQNRPHQVPQVEVVPHEVPSQRYQERAVRRRVRRPRARRKGSA